jgi:ankyrin repeat protein
MRLLTKHGADVRFVHHSYYAVDGRGEAFEHRTDVLTPLMAAVGMGRGTAWVQPDRDSREALMLETVKLVVESGVDLNAANTDGRTALDAAQALKYETVVKFLVANGAKPGVKKEQASPAPVR